MTESNHPLRQLRLKKGWTQVELADKSGVSQQVIHQIESGKTRNPSVRNLSRLAAALGIRLEKLVEK